MKRVIIVIIGVLLILTIILITTDRYSFNVFPSMCYTKLQPSTYFADPEHTYPQEVNNFPVRSGKNNNLVVTNQEGKEISWGHIEGTGSMRPSIGDNTIVLYITNFTREDIHIGDIIVGKREDGIRIIHRVVKITEEGYITKGDNNNVRDSNVWQFEQIIRKVVGVLY